MTDSVVDVTGSSDENSDPAVDENLDTGGGDGQENENPAGDGDAGSENLLTQEQFDKALQKRIARLEKKHKDEIEALKPDADSWRDYKKSNQTDDERRADEAAEIAALRDKLAELEVKDIRREVMQAKGVPASLEKFLVGKTAEEIGEVADELMAAFPAAAKPKPIGGKPAPKDSDSRKSSDADDLFDVDAVLARIPRG